MRGPLERRGGERRERVSSLDGCDRERKDHETHRASIGSIRRRESRSVPARRARRRGGRVRVRGPSASPGARARHRGGARGPRAFRRQGQRQVVGDPHARDASGVPPHEGREQPVRGDAGRRRRRARRRGGRGDRALGGRRGGQTEVLVRVRRSSVSAGSRNGRRRGRGEGGVRGVLLPRKRRVSVATRAVRGALRRRRRRRRRRRAAVRRPGQRAAPAGERGGHTDVRLNVESKRERTTVFVAYAYRCVETRATRTKFFIPH